MNCGAGNSSDSDESDTIDIQTEMTGQSTQPLQPRAEEQLDIAHRFRSPTLLLWGGGFGIAGFILAFVIGLMNFMTQTHNRFGEDYPSGNGYWPSTVSEMVHDWNSPQGRIFFGFCLISAFCIFQSWYPYELRNVYTGDDKMWLCGFECYWITYRQLVPTVGLLLLICVSTVPEEVATTTDQFSVIVHLTGAFMMFVGYIHAETKCLAMCGRTGMVSRRFLDIEGAERKWRVAMMYIILLFFGLFCVLQVVMGGAKTDEVMCCHDKYGPHDGSDTSVEANMRKRMVLIDTASGRFLQVKMASFTSEVIAGLALISSHLVIWYYCEERYVEFGRENIRAVYDEENHEEIAGWDGNQQLLQNAYYPGARDVAGAGF